MEHNPISIFIGFGITMNPFLEPPVGPARPLGNGATLVGGDAEERSSDVEVSGGSSINGWCLIVIQLDFIVI